MSYEQKDGRGSLFRNDRKETERHPDYKGSIKIDGKDYWLSSWISKSEGGTTYMSLSAQLKEQQSAPVPAPASAPAPAPAPAADFNDDVPF